jgi:hypothetical protein
MDTPQSLVAVRRTRRNVIAMGKLVAAGAFGLALTSRDADAASTKPCFLRGTRIRTVDGDRKIEDIRIGDLVVTKSGAAKPVLWVARRRYRRSEGARWVEYIRPVRIARDALGANGDLIQALDLVNGTTIARYPADELDEIEYFHIRLETHDVIYAEDAECESLGDGDYDRFDNFVEYERLFGAQGASPAGRCAPMLGGFGPRARVLSHLRSAASPLVDMRNKLERLRDDLQERADVLAADEKV